MKIGKYISDLLFDKDVVILPNFGAFTKKYIPARFVPELKRVEKPSKIADFDESNKKDDNVLAEYIAKKENIDVSKAKSFIDSFVKEMNDKLKSGKAVEIEKIGKFSPKAGGKGISFEPDKSTNYLNDSIGMGESTKEPEKKADKKKEEEKPQEIKTEKGKKETEEDKKGTVADKQKADTEKKKSEEPVSKKPKTKKIKKKKEKKDSTEKDPQLSPAMKWIAFVAIPLLVIIIIVAINHKYIIEDGKINLNIFSKTETPKTTTPDLDIAVETEETAEEKVEKPEEVRPPHEPEPGKDIYHVVVGSFIEKHKADLFVEDLREQGAERASVFEQTPGGYYRVSYGFYYSMQEAESNLDRIKQSVSQNAWILKR